MSCDTECFSRQREKATSLNSCHLPAQSLAFANQLVAHNHDVSVVPHSRQCLSRASTTRLHAGHTRLAFPVGRHSEIIQPIGPSAAPNIASRTTVSRRLPIHAPTAAQTMVKIIAHSHNFGSVSTAVHSRNSACACSGLAGSIFDNEEKSHAITRYYAPTLVKACSMRSSVRVRPARNTV